MSNFFSSFSLSKSKPLVTHQSESEKIHPRCHKAPGSDPQVSLPSCTLLILRVLISHEHQLKGEYSQKLTMKHVIVQKAEKLVDQIQELCDTWGEFSQTLTGG